MSFLPDHSIADLAINHNMIEPFVSLKTYQRGISHGLSSYGYDVRLGEDFGTYHKPGLKVLDPSNVSDYDIKRTWSQDSFIIPASSFVLAHTLETFRMPPDVFALVKDKSSWARLGIAVQNTMFDPGWVGQPTLEITNHNSVPVKLFVGCGIAQVMFHQGELCSEVYDGQYQDQVGITLPKNHQ